MCRIFGFRSVTESRVHRSLVSADNALAVQSERHPDGWGVAYYVSGAPHVLRSSSTAVHDRLFQRVSGIVTSNTVLAHIRRATQGTVGPLNCHPFQYGRWVMAHNGDVPDFPALRPELLEHVAPKLRGYLLGDTDSELVFHLFLTHLSAGTELSRRGTPVQVVVDALRRTVDTVRETSARSGAARPWLTLLVTDGELMVGHQGGKELWWSSWKNRCAERESCPYFSAECEASTRSGYVNHLLVSSEPLQGENHWNPLAEGEVVAVDHFMHLVRMTA